MKWHSIHSAALLAFALCVPGTLRAQSTVRFDVDESGRLCGAANKVWISGDGRWLFLDTFTPMVANDTNVSGDVYAVDRLTGTVELVSVATSGAQSNSETGLVRSNSDGRFVLMYSDANNLSSPPPITRQAYVRDRQTGATYLGSCNGAGLPADGLVWNQDLSDDGNLVAFATEGTNFGVADPNGTSQDVFLRDRAAGTTTLISATAAGTTGNRGSGDPAISGDGRWIVYLSGASDIVPNDTNNTADLMIYERATGTTTRVYGPGGAQLDGDTGPGVLSFDGSWLAFASNSNNLVPNDTNGRNDVFALDRGAGALHLLTVGLGGAQSDNDSFFPLVSRGGERVSFQSRATNLVPNDDNGGYDAFVADVASGAITRLSVSSTGFDGDPAHEWSGSYPPVVSDDGRFAVFFSSFDGLVAGDTGGGYDPFLRDTLSPCAPVTGYCVAKQNSAGCIPRITSAGDPYASGPDSFYLCALDALADANGMFVWALSSASTPFHGGTLCVATPLVRTRAQQSGPADWGYACAGRYGFHFSHAYQLAHGVGSGATVYGQFYSRDPGFTAPNNVGLTDAIRFTLGP